METFFILDTNVYRRLTEGKYLCEISHLANELRYFEKKVNARSIMSLVVSMELLRHFDDTDPFFMDCFKGLALQYFHTQKKHFGEPDNQIDFIPPLNPILTRHFFENNSEYLPLYYRVIEIVQNATINIEPSDYKKDIGDINKIASQLLHEKNEIKNNFENFIKELNNGVLDWEFFKKEKKYKKKLFSDIKSGRMLDLLSEAQVVRAHSILEKVYPQPDLDERRNSFREYYEPLLRLNQLLLEQMLHGVVALADPQHPKWNTLHDSYLIAAACYISCRERAKNARAIIVTDDDLIHKICKGTYLEDNVWPMRKYLSYIY